MIYHHAARKLSLTCSFALGSIALLAIVAYLIVVAAAQSHRGDTAAVRLSSQQQTLTQATVRHALSYIHAAEPGERERLRQQLGETIDELEAIHERLVRGDFLGASPKPLPAPLVALYFEEPIQLDRQIKHFIRRARNLLDEELVSVDRERQLNHLTGAAVVALLDGLGQVVERYDQQSRANSRLLFQVQTAVVIAILLLLIIEAVVIFRPLIRQIVDHTLALDRAQRSFSGMFNAVSDAIIILDRQLTIRRLNRAAERLFAIDSHELVGTPLARLSPTSVDKIETMIAQGEFNQPKDMAVSLRGGERQMVFEFQINEYSDHGQTLYALSGRDMTQRRQQQQQLRLYESAFMNASDMILIYKEDEDDPAIKRIVYVNPAFTQTTGYQLGHVINKRADVVLTPAASLQQCQALNDAFARQVPTQLELLATRSDGNEFWVEMTVMPTPNEQGEITHYVSIGRDISSRKQREDQIWRVAHLDPLTQLPNRRLFEERLDNVIAQSQKGMFSAVAFIDLDGFKAVNDQLGHEAGDELLKTIAQTLSAAIRPGDLAARLAGDEFTLILVDIDDPSVVESVVCRVMDRVMRSTRDMGPGYEVTLSVGIALIPDDGRSREQVVSNADAAMYAVKRSGKNAYRFVSGHGGTLGEGNVICFPHLRSG